MAEDTLIAKIEIMERCLARISQEYDGHPDNLRKNITRQDSIILNLERLCQAPKDAPMRIVRLK